MAERAGVAFAAMWAALCCSTVVHKYGAVRQEGEAAEVDVPATAASGRIAFFDGGTGRAGGCSLSLAFMDGAAREPVAVGETVGVLRTRHGLEAVFLLGSEERLADSCVLSKLKRGTTIV
jgi:hypothetical protein